MKEKELPAGAIKRVKQQSIRLPKGLARFVSKYAEKKGQSMSALVLIQLDKLITDYQENGLCLFE